MDGTDRREMPTHQPAQEYSMDTSAEHGQNLNGLAEQKHSPVTDDGPVRTHGEPSDGSRESAFLEGIDLSPVPQKSKNARKKELKFLKRAEQMKEKRAVEREQRKRKNLAARQRLQAAATPDQPYITRKVERARGKEKLMVALKEGVKLCVDMSFVDIMSTKEIGQLAQQICYMYATNRKMEKPFCMHVTSLIPGTLLHQEVMKRCAGFENYKIRVFEEPLENLFSKDDIVYMSPDSPNILQEVDPQKVYVIGGLVDGTPKKQASLQRANEIGCTTARLPIKEFMTRVVPHGYNTILTLNQVYEILMRFDESKSWEIALKTCVPQRKGFKLNSELEAAAVSEIVTKEEESLVKMESQ